MFGRKNPLENAPAVFGPIAEALRKANEDAESIERQFIASMDKHATTVEEEAVKAAAALRAMRIRRE